MKPLSLFLYGLCLNAMAVTAADIPLAEGAEVVLLADGFKFTEGPACDAAGNVYFTDQPNNRIHRWGVEGKLSTFLDPAGRANGLFIDKQGVLWACADDKNELWKIDLETAKHEAVVTEYEGKLLNGPNDVWVHPTEGWVYFSDPFFKRPYWERGPMEQEGRFVYLYNPKDGSVKRVSPNNGANGVVGTPDGRTLYAGSGKIFAYDIAQDGRLEKQRVFFEGNTDGMTVDDAGNLFLAAQGVKIISPQGELLHTIEIPEKWCANVCFGGAEKDTLFITASKGLYAVKMRTRGVTP